jgi:plasmid stabilization system protein ParE
MQVEAGAPARERGAAHAARAVSGDVFSKLINLSGRRRFTSQRVVLFAVLAAQGRESALQVSKEALRSFEDAHRLLVKGDDTLPGVFCDALHSAYFGPQGGNPAIEAFVSLAQRTHDALEHGRRAAPALLDELIDSATPLLSALNAITQVYEDLARQQAVQARTRLHELMTDIQSIAKQARFVSFNAQIVASRARESGKEFMVVASELTTITTRMDELVKQAMSSSAGRS